TEQARRLYIERGLDTTRVHVLGMPIDPKFTLPMPSKAELQRQLNLDPQLPTVLLVGGGDGAGGLRAMVYAISQAHLPVQVMVITGRNKRLFVQLQHMRLHLNIPVKVFGFVNNMPEMMHAADVLVTKAGPGTICEALACNLPLILSSFVPGQEEGNVTYVTENKVGVMASNPASIVHVLRRLITPGSDMLKKQLENAQRISRPRASFDIVKHILAYMPAPGEPGVWQNFNPPRPTRLLGRRQAAGVLPMNGLRLRGSRMRQRLLQRSTRTTSPLNLRKTSKSRISLLKRTHLSEKE
ncbi:MAG: glycosyltransferase, partial [Ktedonobacteraceae bacterium]